MTYYVPYVVFVPYNIFEADDPTPAELTFKQLLKEKGVDQEE